MQYNGMYQQRMNPQNREKLCYDQAISAFKSAYHLYLKVERKAKWRRFFCRLLRRNYFLPELSTVLECSSLKNSASTGVQAVELIRIRGSENRSQDFDSAFQPLIEKNRERWIRIAAMCLNLQALPAVDLIQVNDDYFVRDGHHRISVMRALGYRFVDANVTVFQMAETGKGTCFSG